MSGPRFAEVFSTTWKVVLSLAVISLVVAVMYFVVSSASTAPSGPGASGVPYLYAAYISTWVIHIAYLGYLLSRYNAIRKEIEELKGKR